MGGIGILVLVGAIVIGSVSRGGTETTETGEGGISSSRVTFSEAVGKPAPDFTLEAIDGSTVDLKSLRGKTVVLFFNEGSMCYPGCWNQVKELAADQRFNTANVVSYSVVVETSGAWKQIMERKPEYKVSNMLFDTSRKVSRAYDVMSLASSMHKGGYPGHTYVVIDPQGMIRYTLDDPSMGIRNDDLTAEIQKLTL